MTASQQAVSLPRQGQITAAGAIAIVTGWGVTHVSERIPTVEVSMFTTSCVSSINLERFTSASDRHIYTHTYRPNHAAVILSGSYQLPFTVGSFISLT
jgi:hypothetical protein